MVHAPVIIRIASLLLVIAGAGLLFGVLSWWLKIEGFSEFLGVISRKLRRRA